MCLRFSSREISSTPCVRPSSVWKGMNDSGTNSVIPPVRSCSSRTTRMCSASSHGSSMWPNITVAVERSPARWRGFDDLHPARHRQLVRRDPLAHAVVQDLGGGARRRAEAGVAQAREHLRAAASAEMSHMCAISIGLYACRCSSAPTRRALGEAQPAEVVLERPVGVDARLDADLARAVVDRVLGTRRDELPLVVLVGVGRALALAEAAERAADGADVRDVDVAVDDERHRLARELAAQLVGGLAHLLDRLRTRLGEQRRQLLGLERRALARALGSRPRRGRGGSGRAARCAPSRAAG